MTSRSERNGALEAIERILNRGGDADDALRQVLDVLGRLYAYAGIRFVDKGELVAGPSVGTHTTGSARRIEFQDTEVAQLEISDAADDDAQFLDRVATIISPYCLVGWDTGGETWTP